jgi:hypothetical protein
MKNMKVIFINEMSKETEKRVYQLLNKILSKYAREAEAQKKAEKNDKNETDANY